MRILVLHPAASSSECMRELLAPLAGALAARHGIALAYTDAPLLYQGGRENENAGQAGDGRNGERAALSFSVLLQPQERAPTPTHPELHAP